MCQKIWKSGHAENITIIVQIENHKLSVYFRSARSSHFWHVIMLLLKIHYRYHTVHVRWQTDPYEMPKTWNISYHGSMTCKQVEPLGGAG